MSNVHICQASTAEVVSALQAPRHQQPHRNGGPDSLRHRGAVHCSHNTCTKIHVDLWLHFIDLYRTHFVVRFLSWGLFILCYPAAILQLLTTANLNTAQLGL